MSEFNARPTDPQITVSGRTFCVRHVLMGGMFDAFVVLEKRGVDWINVSDSGAPKPTDADFETEAGVTAWLNKLSVWINAQFAKIFGTVPTPNIPVLGTDGKADRAVQSRIRLVASGNGVVAQVIA